MRIARRLVLARDQLGTLNLQSSSRRSEQAAITALLKKFIAGTIDKLIRASSNMHCLIFFGPKNTQNWDLTAQIGRAFSAATIQGPAWC